MKTVICVLVALVVVNAQSQSCPTVLEYSEKIYPVGCSNDLRILLPNYEDPKTFYSCSSGNAILTNCPSNTFFSYTLQDCVTCEYFIPSVPCSYLELIVTCVPIAAAT